MLSDRYFSVDYSKKKIKTKKKKLNLKRWGFTITYSTELSTVFLSEQQIQMFGTDIQVFVTVG